MIHGTCKELYLLTAEYYGKLRLKGRCHYGNVWAVIVDPISKFQDWHFVPL